MGSRGAIGCAVPGTSPGHQGRGPDGEASPVSRWRSVVLLGGANGQSRPPETVAVCSGDLSLSGKPRLRGRDLFLVGGATYTVF